MVKDHLSQEFESVVAMCDSYNIDRSTFDKRIQSGWTLEKALTYVVLSNNSKKPVKDHLGNKYSCKDEMCKKYGIKVSTFNARRHRGWSLEKALTFGLNEQHRVVDHLGNSFDSAQEMCKFWNIKFSTYDNRIRRGWSIERALTTKKKVITEGCTDHLGKFHKSERAMCKAWGVPFTNYRSRKSLGWDIEAALTTPFGEVNASQKESIDHLGNIFKSRAEMVRYWSEKTGIPEQSILGRLDHGETIEQAVSRGIRLNLKKLYGGWRPIKLVYEDGLELYYLCTKNGMEEVISKSELEVR